MTEKKLSFSIEDARVIKENPDSNFAIVSLDFFASGESLNDTYVSEENLLKTADTIKNCPLIWKYDPNLKDAYTHDKDEVPCGFVPDSSEIKNKKLSDGRTMLSTTAYIWKRYTGELINIFKRDGGVKPVSVELMANEVKSVKKGTRELLELIDWRYEGITILGTYVAPAIPSANATVLSFSELETEYNKDLIEEFGAPDINMKIPEEIKDTVEVALAFEREYSVADSLSLSFAKYLYTEEVISEDKVRLINNFFEKYPEHYSPIDSIPPTGEFILWGLHGGTAARNWAQPLVEQISNAKEVKRVKKENAPMTNSGEKSQIEDLEKSTAKSKAYLSEENSGKEEENMGKEVMNKDVAMEEEKDTPKAEEEMAEEMAGEEMAEEKPAEEMAEESDEDASEEKEEMAEDASEEKEEMAEDDKKEEVVSEAKKEMQVNPMGEMSAPEELADEVAMSMNVTSILDFISSHAPVFQDMNDKYSKKILEVFGNIATEISKGKYAKARKLNESMLSFMREASAKIVAMGQSATEKITVLSTEVDELRNFKKTVEAEKFAFEVDSVLDEAFQAGMPKDKIDELKEESREFSLNTIDVFKNMVKAKAFVFMSAHKSNGQEEDFVVIGLPFSDEKPKEKTIWE